METTNPDAARQIARAACDFELKRSGSLPTSVAVVLSGDTMVITLHGSLSPAEQALAKTPAGAIQAQEFHRQLFENSGDALKQEIKRITGVDVREAAVEIDPSTGAVIKAFTTGTVVQVFLLADKVSPSNWSGDTSFDKS